MATSASLRSKLFHEGSEALAAFSAKLHDRYACPQCLRLFGPDALGGPDPDLTLEHIPPQAAYGSPYMRMLVCKRCNNTAGSAYESHLSTRVQTTPVTNDDPRDAKIEIGDFTLQGTISVNSEGAVVVANDPRRNDPKAIEEVSTGLHQGTLTESFQVHVSLGYNQRLSSLAHLRIGYLVAFGFLGYRYIVRQSLDAVREQLAHPYSLHLASTWSLRTSDTTHDRTVLLVEDPIEALGIRVADQLILLPSTSDALPASTFYDKLSELPEPLEVSASKWIGWPSTPDHRPWNAR